MKTLNVIFVIVSPVSLANTPTYTNTSAHPFAFSTLDEQIVPNVSTPNGTTSTFNVYPKYKHKTKCKSNQISVKHQASPSTLIERGFVFFAGEKVFYNQYLISFPRVQRVFRS